MATDDLIMASQGDGAKLRDLLATEIAAYDASRISMSGPDCILSPKLALTMALLVHELATNAAKYGALSSAAGKLSITWSLAGTKTNPCLGLKAAGRPSFRPAIAALERGCFSGRLDSSMDRSIAIFAPTGLQCRLTVVLPDQTPAPAQGATGKTADTVAAD